MQIYITCGVWRSSENKEWRFIVDGEKRARLLTLQSNTTLKELKKMVAEDYEIGHDIIDMEFSYLPIDLSVDSPPVVMTNQRQLQNFVGYLKRNSTTRLCVTFQPRDGNRSSEFNIDSHKQSWDPSNGNNNGKVLNKRVALMNEDKPNVEFFKVESNVDVAPNVEAAPIHSLVKKGQLFPSKEALQAHLEICAMKYNFDYRITKSEKKLWCIRCVDIVCKWSIRAECLGGGSSYFKINKYVAKHTCAPSNKSKFSRTPSARTIGHLIMHKYEGVKEGPKPNDIRNIMRTDYGFELSYNQAWESREYAVNEVRGIPEKSYAKIPKYLYMLEEANPGTYSKYETDCDGRFKYLFISFGPSIRGFYKAIRKVIVIDGTFLKSKYKGVLLVATAVDGNSNLYPLAFGIADSENDLSWEWFFVQLKVIIDDEEGLAFISDRHLSIGKSLAKIYPLAKHGICIHHLLNNVVKHKGKGLAGLIAKASKVYRVGEFDKLFTQICSSSLTIGTYLKEAGVEKWARYHFPGYRYDIRTTNPAESINAALKSPREYPVIPLLDSIREMLTRWFYERRTLSAKHTDPLTVDVEKKIDRRIEKAKTLIAYKVDENTFEVKGDDSGDYVVDLKTKTCSCGKLDLVKIPCRHAIKAAFAINKDLHPYADDVWTTTAWRSLYEETIDPIGMPENEWNVPEDVEDAKVLPPETRRGPGRRKIRRYQTVEDKIRSSQGSKKSKKHTCSRCGQSGHNRTTCEIEI